MSTIYEGIVQPVILVISTFAVALYTYTSFAQRDSKLENRQKYWVSDISILLGYLFLGLSLFIFFSSAFRNIRYNYLSNGFVNRLKETYFEAILRKNISWFQQNKTGDLATKFNKEMDQIEECIGKSLFEIIFAFSGFCIMYIICLVLDFKMALLMIISTALIIFTIVAVELLKKESDKTSSFSVAEQVFTCIKTVIFFDQTEKECNRYNKVNSSLNWVDNKHVIITSIGTGLMSFFLFLSFPLGLSYIYFNAKFSITDYKESQKILYMMGVIVFSLIACISIQDTPKHIISYLNGKSMAAKVFRTIDQPTKIDPLQDGIIKKRATGLIEIQNVTFGYDENKPIFNNLNLTIPAGKTVAFVGPSGSGKSTLIKLIQRFYDPQQGSIKFDGIDLKDLNLKYYRKQIGYVGQEPVLFDTSIYQNVAWGINQDGNLCLDDVMEVCKQANAHDFISKLANQYYTNVGNQGGLLSIGQKQRICIARAIVNEPPILLLDEATSSLDSLSEKIVQDALNKSSSGKTTIIIAHRLSTIKNADIIVAFKEGKVVETGSHDELMKSKGLYHDLVVAQDIESYSPVPSNSIKDPLDQKEWQKEKNTRKLCKSNKNSLISYMMEYKILLLISILCCVLDGFILPYFSRILVKLLDIMISDKLKKGIGAQSNIYYLSPRELDSHYKENILTRTYEFLGLCVAALISQIGKLGIVRVVENFVKADIKLDVFSSVLKQEIAFFDEQENAPGTLCTRIDKNTENAPLLVTNPLVLIVTSLSSLILTLYFSLSINRKLTIIMVSIIPFLVIAIIFKNTMLKRNQQKQKQAYERACRVSTEAISNIQTIASLALESIFLKIFINLTKESKKIAKTHLFVNSLCDSFNQALFYMYISVNFFVGSGLIRHGECSSIDVIFVGIFTSIFCSYILKNLSYLDSVSSARVSSNILFEMKNRKPLINAPVSSKTHQIDGNIEFNEVTFSYKSRKDRLVFDKLNLNLPSNKNIAIVGNSGSGKSTLLSLILGFYDADSGKILIQGEDIKNWDIKELRKQLSYVEQEPKLLNYSIIDNIRFSKQDANFDEIVNAAKMANIHDFILSLPEGYNTIVGERGSTLSGGQKQRICIARAILRNPKVLLLDEATSSLDSISENFVQKAIENVSKGRTCISIAHRISSIIHCDIIFVMKDGVLVECGTHHELMDRRGYYYELADQQNLI